MDSSEDLSPEEWTRLKDFTKEFVGRFPKVSPLPDGTRFGLITYANNPAVHFNFRKLEGPKLNTNEVKNLVGQTPRRPGTNRRIDSALDLAERELFSNRGGSRQGAKKVGYNIGWFAEIYSFILYIRIYYNVYGSKLFVRLPSL